MLYLSVFLSSVNGSNNFIGSKLSVVNFETSLSLIKIYDIVSFNPKPIILFLISLVVLSYFPVLVGSTGSFPSILSTP